MKTTAKPKQKRERKRPASASLPSGTWVQGGLPPLAIWSTGARDRQENNGKAGEGGCREARAPRRAWVLHRLKAAGERGVTLATSLRKSEASTRCVTVTEAPGQSLHHTRGYRRLPADRAVLTVAAGAGELEAGSAESGQAREQALRACTPGGCETAQPWS